jgi:hypothetical protein
MKDNWEGKLDFQRAETMVRKLAQYVLVMRSEGRSLLGVEQDFEVRLPDLPPMQSDSRDGQNAGGPDSGGLDAGGLDSGSPDPASGDSERRAAVLRGQVDRLEIDSEGRLVVVDLKTGKRQPGKTELSRHPQLGAYQAAVLAGGFRDLPGMTGPAVPGGAVPGGAVLAQLGTTTKSPGVQQQEPLDPQENWALEMVADAAALMSGNSFEARHDPAKGSHGGHGCRLPEVCPLCVRGKQVTE